MRLRPTYGQLPCAAAAAGGQRRARGAKLPPFPGTTSNPTILETFLKYRGGQVRTKHEGAPWGPRATDAAAKLVDEMLRHTGSPPMNRKKNASPARTGSLIELLFDPSHAWASVPMPFVGTIAAGDAATLTRGDLTPAEKLDHFAGKGLALHPAQAQYPHLCGVANDDGSVAFGFDLFEVWAEGVSRALNSIPPKSSPVSQRLLLPFSVGARNDEVLRHVYERHRDVLSADKATASGACRELHRRLQLLVSPTTTTLAMPASASTAPDAAAALGAGVLQHGGGASTSDVPNPFVGLADNPLPYIGRLTGDAATTYCSLRLPTAEKSAWFTAKGIPLHRVQLEDISLATVHRKDILFSWRVFDLWYAAVRPEVVRAHEAAASGTPKEEVAAGFACRMGPKHERLVEAFLNVAGSNRGLPAANNTRGVRALYKKLALAAAAEGISAATLLRAHAARGTRPPLVGNLTPGDAEAIRAVPYPFGTPEFFAECDARGICGSSRQFHALRAWTERWRSDRFEYGFSPCHRTFMQWLARLAIATDDFANPSLKMPLGTREEALLECLRDLYTHSTDFHDLVSTLRLGGGSQTGLSSSKYRMLCQAVAERLACAMRGDDAQRGGISAAEIAETERLREPPLRMPYIAKWGPVPAVVAKRVPPAAKLLELEKKGQPGTLLQLSRPKRNRAWSAQWFYWWLQDVRNMYHLGEGNRRTRSIGAHERVVLKALVHFGVFELMDEFPVLTDTRARCARFVDSLRFGPELYAELLKGMQGGDGETVSNERRDEMVAGWRLELASLVKRRALSSNRKINAGKLPRDNATQISFGKMLSTYVRLPYVGTPSAEVLAHFKAMGGVSEQLRYFDVHGIPCSTAQWRRLLNWWKYGVGDGASGTNPVVEQSFGLKRTLWKYLNDLMEHGVFVPRATRRRYFGPTEDLLVEYVRGLGIDSRRLALHIQKPAWAEAVYATLAEIIKERVPPSPATVAAHRALGEAPLEGSKDAKGVLVNSLRMPYVGVIPEQLRVFLNQAVRKSDVIDAGLHYTVMYALDEMRVPGTLTQVRHLLQVAVRGKLEEEETLEKAGSLRAWIRWAERMAQLTAPPDGVEAGAHSAILHAAVRRLGITPGCLGELPHGAVRALYKDLCYAMATDSCGHIQPLPEAEAANEAAAFVDTLRSAEAFYGQTLRRLPMVGMPDVTQLVYLLKSTALNAGDCKLLDAAGVPLDPTQASQGARRATGARRTSDTAQILQLYTTAEPIASFRAWLEAVLDDRARPVEQRVLHLGEHMEHLLDTIAAEDVRSVDAARALSDDAAGAVYEELVGTLRDASAGGEARRSPRAARAQETFAAAYRGSWKEVVLEGGAQRDPSSAAWRRRLPFVARRGGVWSGHLIRAVADMTAAVDAHAILKGRNATVQTLALIRLENDGIPGTPEQVAAIIAALSAGMDKDAPPATISVHDTAPATHTGFRRWARVLVDSRQTMSRNERIVVYGGHVDAYDEVLDALGTQDPFDWSEETTAIAYSRMCWAGGSTRTGVCAAATAPEPWSLTMGITAEEYEFARSERAAAAVPTVPPMPYVGSPVSDDHAALLLHSWKSSSTKLVELVRRGLPGSHRQVEDLAEKQSLELRRNRVVDADALAAMGSSAFRMWFGDVLSLTRRARKDKTDGEGAVTMRDPLLVAVADMGLSVRDVEEASEADILRVYDRLLPVYAKRAATRGWADEGAGSLLLHNGDTLENLMFYSELTANDMTLDIVRGMSPSRTFVGGYILDYITRHARLDSVAYGFVCTAHHHELTEGRKEDDMETPPSDRVLLPSADDADGTEELHALLLRKLEL